MSFTREKRLGFWDFLGFSGFFGIFLDLNPKKSAFSPLLTKLFKRNTLLIYFSIIDNNPKFKIASALFWMNVVGHTRF